MAMEKNRMTLNLAGQEFRLASDSSVEYMRALEAEINRRVREIQNQYPQQSTSRCALLAMLSMTDELTKLRSEFAEVDRKISELRTLRDGEKTAVTAPVKRPFERKKPVGV